MQQDPRSDHRLEPGAPLSAKCLGRIALAALLLSAQLPASKARADVAGGDTIKILGIDQNYSLTHGSTLSVAPGRYLVLSADVLDATQTPEQRDSASFVWRAKSNLIDESCDAANAQACASETDFAVTDYGVGFTVPDGDWTQITLSVASKDADEAGSAGDSITLVNSSTIPASIAPAGNTPPVVDPADYPYPSLDYSAALHSYGSWVSVDGSLFFVPNTFIAADDDGEWVPYRHGRWAWDAGLGWTWVSYDPWGWVTDHYGVWRFHETYGWIWAPFDGVPMYQPAVVAFFDDGDYFGWMPFWEGYAYRSGRAAGFIDGYWLGYRAAFGYGQAHYVGHPGFSIVRRVDVTHENVYKVVINRTKVINQKTINVVRNAFVHKTFAGVPGGDAKQARAFVETKASVKAVEVTTTKVGRAQIMEPSVGGSGKRDLPDAYRQIATATASKGRPLAPGTVVKIGFNSAGAVTSAKPVPPFAGGHGLANAPVVHDASGKPVATIAPLSHKPGVPTAGNPISTSKPPAPTLPVKPKPPVHPVTPPPHNGGGTNPPPHNGGGTTPPPHGGGGTTPPPHNGGGTTPPPHNGGGTTPPPHNGGGTTPPPHNGGGTTPPPHNGGGTTPPPHNGGGTTPPPHHSGGSSAPAPHYNPPAPHYDPPAPHYDPPAPHYDPPAPHYDPPAPHYDPPTPHYSPPPEPPHSEPSGGGGHHH